MISIGSLNRCIPAIPRRRKPIHAETWHLSHWCDHMLLNSRDAKNKQRERLIFHFISTRVWLQPRKMWMILIELWHAHFWRPRENVLLHDFNSSCRCACVIMRLYWNACTRCPTRYNRPERYSNTAFPLHNIYLDSLDMFISNTSDVPIWILISFRVEKVNATEHTLHVMTARNSLLRYHFYWMPRYRCESLKVRKIASRCQCASRWENCVGRNSQAFPFSSRLSSPRLDLLTFTDVIWKVQLTANHVQYWRFAHSISMNKFNAKNSW